MSHQGIDVDQLDLGANSPLHLAAKEGHTSSVASLLNFGAMVSLKVLIYYINIHNLLKKFIQKKNWEGQQVIISNLIF